MELKEFIEQLKRRNNEIPETLMDYLQQAVANDLSTMIKTRVMQKELNKDNKLFPEYSKAYAAYRKRKKKINTNKNFLLTGDMWTHFGVIKSYSKGNLITVELGGTSDSAQDKINWQAIAPPKGTGVGYSIIENTALEREAVMIAIGKWLMKNLAKK